ncbi:hypothetical protein ACH5RR_004592 [Cinchona calisaya]|uniref:Transcription initiation factor TFIID subunit 12 domain-containing protein n=1 Tax=Cinchona calisaya TaxID=153742 RepID=A0ABD3AY63_9GENT
MEEQQQTPTPQQSTTQPPEHPQQPPPPPSPSPSTPITTTTTTSSSISLPPPTTTSSLPPPTTAATPTSTPQTRPPAVAVAAAAAAAFNRPWQQPPQSAPYSHFALPPPPLPLPSHSSSSPSTSTVSAPISPSPSLSVPPPQRGGMAIGVPAHHSGTPPPQSASFSSLTPPSFGQPFGGLGRNVTDSGPTSTSSQIRPTVGGMQGIGMMGTLGASSAMRPTGGVPIRPPVQSSPRPQSTPSTQSPATQNFQGHGMLRVSSVGSPGSPSPGSLQGPQPQNQPWLNSGSQVKPPLPPSRPQIIQQSMQQRSHISQQHHHAMTTSSQQQQASSPQQSQQPSTSTAGPQEHFGQQFPQSRIQQPLPNQQLTSRNLSLGTQRPSHSTIPSTPVQSVLPNRAEPEEPCNRILSKRSIQELVTQVDPSEKLDPEVEDILVDIAEDFVESITTFGCSLAKHRKSTTLEAKDILLHLERNWNITLPGFGGDEIKMYKKPFTSDIHRERLAVIKKSILAGETTNSRSLAGQAGGNPKGHLAKGPTSIVGSPPAKVREAA